jgi:hypothetical protein
MSLQNNQTEVNPWQSKSLVAYNGKHDDYVRDKIIDTYKGVGLANVHVVLLPKTTFVNFATAQECSAAFNSCPHMSIDHPKLGSLEINWKIQKPNEFKKHSKPASNDKRSRSLVAHHDGEHDEDTRAKIKEEFQKYIDQQFPSEKVNVHVSPGTTFANFETADACSAALDNFQLMNIGAVKIAWRLQKPKNVGT